MMFFVGVHHPHKAGHVPLAMVSANALKNRKSHFPAGDWLLDSGAFTIINKHGGYPEPVETYAALIRRFANCGNLMAAVAQDYMCEPFVLERTGLTVADHQRLTIERYREILACDTAGVTIMPVLQGYQPHEYVSHIRQYGDLLTEGMWVGVGSVCKRNAKPLTARAVFEAIHAERPDLRLHGFGIKLTALHDQRVRDLLWSADSMAWSYAARYEGRDGNDINEAIRYVAKVNAQPVQMVMMMADEYELPRLRIVEGQ